MRVFVAIDLPEGVRRALEPVQEALPVGRLADPDQLHLTLAFLGEQPDDMVQAAHEALETVTFPAFEMQLSGLDTFGGRAPSVLWAGVKEAAPLKALHARVRDALHGVGLPLERRRFRPHVTLARFEDLAPDEEERLARFLSRWHGFPAPPFQVDGMGLWRSTLTRGGAIHDELMHYPLQGAGVGWDDGPA